MRGMTPKNSLLLIKGELKMEMQAVSKPLSLIAGSHSHLRLSNRDSRCAEWRACSQAICCAKGCGFSSSLFCLKILTILS